MFSWPLRNIVLNLGFGQAVVFRSGANAFSSDRFLPLDVPDAVTFLPK